MTTFADAVHAWKEATFAQFSWGNLSPEMLYASFDAFCEEHGLESLTFEQFQMQAETTCNLLRMQVRPVMHELFANSGQIPIEFEETLELVKRMHPGHSFTVTRN